MEMSVHDATLNPSDGLKHAAHFLQYLKRGEMPYRVLIESDGGPDHNLTFLRNIVFNFGMFLASEIDILILTRGVSGLSCYNTCEKVMSNLSIGTIGLSLMMDPDADEWLMNDVIGGVTTMKGVRKSIGEWDEAIPIAIGILERRLAKIEGGNNASDEMDVSNGSEDEDEANITSQLGDKIVRFFEGYGRFIGEVTSINPNAPEGKCIRIKYEDDDEEDITQEQFDAFQKESSIPIGGKGFRFIKKFGGAGYFSATVIRILPNGKRLCKFCDGQELSYTLDKLQRYSNIKLKERNESEGEDDSDDSEDEVDSDSDAEMADTNDG